LLARFTGWPPILRGWGVLAGLGLVAMRLPRGPCRVVVRASLRSVRASGVRLRRAGVGPASFGRGLLALPAAAV
jgi:hypothetical protein